MSEKTLQNELLTLRSRYSTLESQMKRLEGNRNMLAIALSGVLKLMPTKEECVRRGLKHSLNRIVLAEQALSRRQDA